MIVRLAGKGLKPESKQIPQVRVPALLNQGGDFMAGGGADSAETAAAAGGGADSGMMEIGWNYEPKGDNRFSVDISAIGWVGRQRGFTGRLGINWLF